MAQSVICSMSCQLPCNLCRGHILCHHREHRAQRGSGVNYIVQTGMHTCLGVLTCRVPTCHVRPLGSTNELGVHHKLRGCGVQTGAGVQVHKAFPGTSLVAYSSPFATCVLPFTHLLLCSHSASDLRRPTLQVTACLTYWTYKYYQDKTYIFDTCV